MFRLRSLLILSLTLLAASAFAATLNVGPGQPFITIQSAIIAANPGDTVLVYPGTYYENIDFLGKAITVTSAAGPATTIIDGGYQLPTVIFYRYEQRSSVLNGFTIRSGGPYTLRGYQGGGIVVQDAAPTITNNVITGNQCSGIYIDFAAPLVQANEISNTSQDGSALCPYEGNAVVVGGGITNPGLLSGLTHADIIGNLIDNNGAAVMGSGLYLATYGVVVQNNTIQANASVTGAAIYIRSFLGFDIEDNVISGNTSSSSGAIYIDGYSQAAIGSTPAYLRSNTITGNILTGPANIGSQITINCCVNTLTIVDNIVTGQSAPLIAATAQTTQSGGILPVFDHNDAYSASGSPYDGVYLPSQTGISGNISADPLFRNAPSGDFHLLNGSPVIDTGTNNTPGLPATDFDGNPRIQNVTGTPCAIIDMGAYEYPGSPDACANIAETLQSSLNPSIAGQSITFTVQLTSPLGTPTGDVQFSDGTNVLAAQPISSSGLSIYTTASLSIGAHSITAAYQPTGAFSPASASLTQQVNGYTTTTTLTPSLNPSLATQSVTFTAAVASSSGTPTGSVQFFDGSTLLATQTLTSAIATYSTSTLAAGTHNMQAVYVPTGSFAASTGTLTQIVTGIGTATNLSCNPTPLYITQKTVLFATVTSTNGIPTGSVTFTDNGVAILPTPPFTAGATATESNYQFTTPGTHTIVAAYVPSGNFAASSASCSVVVNLDPTTTALTSSVEPSVFSQPVTFTATVTFGPPVINFAGYGTVTFSDGAAVLQTVTINSTSVSGVGTAACTTSALAQGMHNITATLYPNSVPFIEYASSSASFTQVVNNVPTTIALSASPNPAPQGQLVTITAKVVSSTGAAPPGTVSFLDSGAVIGITPVNSSGVATLTSSTLALGNHLLVAVYVPDPTSYFLASSSNDFTETIEPAVFTIALSPGTLILTAGMTGSATVQLASGGLFSGPLTLSFGALPQYATGTLSTAAVTLTAGGNASSTFSLQTSMIGANSIPPRPGSRPQTITLCALLLALPLAFRRRGRLRNLFILCAAAFLLQTLTACTTIRTPLHLVPTGTYRIPFTATDANNNTHTQSLTLIIQ